MFMSLELIRAGGGLLQLHDCYNAEGRSFIFSILRILKNTKNNKALNVQFQHVIFVIFVHLFNFLPFFFFAPIEHF